MEESSSKFIKDYKELIPVAEPHLNGNELKYLRECIKTNWISSGGRFVNDFEKEFAKYCGVKYGVSTCNGTAALHLSLLALGIEKNDEVIVPALTFISTANATIYCAAKPVFVDSHPRYWCIDPQKIEEKINKRTKAIIVVHLYGHPCDMDAILKIAKKYKLYVIEDCAEAHGAEYKGKKVGSFGDISCFSFYGNKIITTGEGGMCLTNNKELEKRMRLFRNQGMSEPKKYWHTKIGYNYRMTNLQAAVGLAQLEKIEAFIKARVKNAEIYNSVLKEIPGITFLSNESWARNVYWMYSILINKDKTGLSRNGLIKELMKRNIETRPFFYPIPLLPPYRKFNDKKLHYPVAERLSREGLNLPSSSTLTRKKILYIAETIRNLSKHT